MSLEQIAEIVGGAGDAILTVDINGTVIYVNKKVEEVYGDRDVVGRRFIDVDIFGTDSLHEKEVWFHDLSVLLQQENPPLAEVELLRGDGTPIYTEVSSRPLRKDGQGMGHGGGDKGHLGSQEGRGETPGVVCGGKEGPAGDRGGDEEEARVHAGGGARVEDAVDAHTGLD